MGLVYYKATTRKVDYLVHKNTIRVLDNLLKTNQTLRTSLGLEVSPFEHQAWLYKQNGFEYGNIPELIGNLKKDNHILEAVIQVRRTK